MGMVYLTCLNQALLAEENFLSLQWPSYLRKHGGAWQLIVNDKRDACFFFCSRLKSEYHMFFIFTETCTYSSPDQPSSELGLTLGPAASHHYLAKVLAEIQATLKAAKSMAFSGQLQGQIIHKLEATAAFSPSG
uniref:Uncharacterized protein n=1 Tax=Anthoceros punctatus TaxID=3234 RepID=A0A6M8B079_ANTPU|nr:hypothetical protein [Anthoceros punctatus]QKD76581.1 hypothetical protein [Anthoceros punctatus]